MTDDTGPASEPRGGIALGAILALGLAVRVVGLGQPIVENYVGRQVPTAMVARNLERGSGFLEPVLDVAPFPNRFLVEPPVYAAVVVALRRATALPLEASGRLVSALGIVAGGWGLFGLVARRSGLAPALLAAAAFVTFPVTVRYGRSFQPDALMLGCLLAGACCWDRFEWDRDRGRGRGRGWLAAGLLAVSAGLAIKVLSAFVLLPLLAVVVRDRRPATVALVLATLAPALLWYAYAAGVLADPGGSRASADNGAIWLRALDPSALARPATLGHLVRFLGVRAFTPLGPALALAGLIVWGGGDRLWPVWGASALAALAAVAAKLHHEYYWLALAPVVAAGVGQALAGLARQGALGRRLAVAAGAGLLALDAAFAAPTWRTPPEWRTLPEAAAAVRAAVPAGALVAAPEALLFYADRKGCRIEYTAAAARRAAGEWGGGAVSGTPIAIGSPIDLVEFYRHRGASHFADVAADGPARLALHEAVRRRYNVVMDRSGVLIAALNEPDDGATPEDATRPRAR